MTLAILHQQGSSMRAMARMLGRPASTISREFERNRLGELPLQPSNDAVEVTHDQPQDVVHLLD